ncbi:MAG: RNase adapter RapZ [Eubacteriales bacterium]|nr:RNase adapter RapZ [Eubacteriales bacterium]
MDLVIVTGLSGAGKTSALNVLEDSGFLCVDNLPTPLIDDLVQLLESKNEVKKLALVLDKRNRFFTTGLDQAILDLKERYKAKVLFFNARNESLIKRFKERRRPHPLEAKGSILAGIEAERKALENLKTMSQVIDTSDLTLGELKQVILSAVELKEGAELQLIFNTFGFKHGICLDADMVFDVRFIQNPFYVAELKEKSGYVEEVYRYVIEREEVLDFLEKIEDLLLYLIPLYKKEGKNQLVVAFGCTGGRQRSVSIARYLEASLQKKGIKPIIIHRDLELEDE